LLISKIKDPTSQIKQSLVILNDKEYFATDFNVDISGGL